jgi:hypothetical protein
MANKFNGFLDSVAGSALNPKGNLADYQHASRLYTDNNHALAPKTKFLYHVFFDINKTAAGIIPRMAVDGAKIINEIGMLVKSADLPKFSAKVETKKMYNRVKNVQTAIEYDPVTITFHDDNSSLTTALLQAYYRYYFADGNQKRNSGRAYSRTPDSTYEGPERNRNKFGLDNNNPGLPFFNSIQISQLSRGSYVTYTLVNPIITSWGHDRLDNQDAAGVTENQIQIAYEAVFYDAGKIEAGANGEPKGFGQDHYDTTPSPLSITGGGTTSIGSIVEGALDLYDYITGGDTFKNPLEAALAAANLIGNVRNMSSEGLRQGAFNILTRAVGNVAGINVGGVAQTLFPKSGGNGGQGKLLLATAGAAVAVSAINNYRQRQELQNNPAALESAARAAFGKDFQNNGNAGGVNERNAAWNGLPSSAQQIYRNRALGVNGT